MWAGKLPEGWDKGIPTFPADRQGTGQPHFVGQGAQRPRQALSLADRRLGRPGPLDDDAARRTRQASAASNYAGRNLHFGIREHGMAAICNGMSLSGLRPYGATFFVFTDYMRPAMRLSAIMHRPVIYVLTHDSIGLGEDGPTHQPIEHLSACRAIPGLDVVRPGDANEVAECYRTVIQRLHAPGGDGPLAAEPADARPHEVRPRRRRARRAATSWPKHRAASRRRSSWPPAASSISP